MSYLFGFCLFLSSQPGSHLPPVIKLIFYSPFFGHLFTGFAYTNLYAVQYIQTPNRENGALHAPNFTMEKGDVEMRTWKLRSGEERPVAQDVDDLIFDSNEEWSASER